MNGESYPHFLGLLFIVTVLNCYLGWLPAHVADWWRDRKEGKA